METEQRFEELVRKVDRITRSMNITDVSKIAVQLMCVEQMSRFMDMMENHGFLALNKKA